MMSQRSKRVAWVYLKRGALRNWQHDLPASIVVYLVALPLCLGISLASDAPLISGMITGIIAGIVVSILSGSELSVSGPAAGLTVIVASGIASLGGFENFLCAVVISGCIQIVAGYARCGAIATLFPNSVIKGMLWAIGVTIILKQIPHTFGGFSTFQTEVTYITVWGVEHFLDLIWSVLNHIQISALLIASGSLALLIAWEKPVIKSNPYLGKIPGPLLAVILGAGLNQIFHANFPSIALRAEDGHLVQLPVFDSIGGILSELKRPDFGGLWQKQTWILAITLAAVGSIETLLCLESTDKLDPLRRVSNTNRELKAQGIGNLLAGLLGGIPMTSVIVRSSANVYSGARGRLSAFLHGAFLLISLLALSSILNFIPLASLAAVLLVVGFKLAHPKYVTEAYHAGWSQFVPFAITISAILLTNLLTGVLIGLGVGLIFVVAASYYSALTVVREDGHVLIRFTKDATFIHKLKLRKELAAIEPGSHVYFDGRRASYFDNDILEMLQIFVDTASLRNIKVELRDVKEKTPTREARRLERKRHGNVQKVAISK